MKVLRFRALPAFILLCIVCVLEGCLEVWREGLFCRAIVSVLEGYLVWRRVRMASSGFVGKLILLGVHVGVLLLEPFVPQALVVDRLANSSHLVA